MKSPRNGRFCWPSHSSNGVDPVVSSHSRLCGHFTGCTKTKQQRVEGKKQINTDLELQTQESEVGTLKHSCMYLCSWLSQELCKNPTQQPKMLTHLIIVLTFQLPASESHS